MQPIAIIGIVWLLEKLFTTLLTEPWQRTALIILWIVGIFCLSFYAGGMPYLTKAG